MFATKDHLLKYTFNGARGREALDYEGFDWNNIGNRSMADLEDIADEKFLEEFGKGTEDQKKKIRKNIKKWKSGCLGIVRNYGYELVKAGVGFKPVDDQIKELAGVVTIEQAPADVRGLFEQIAEKHGSYRPLAYGDILAGPPTSTLDLLDVFAITRYNKDNDPIKLPKSKRLTLKFHGTRFVNVAGILRNGFLPHIPDDISTSGSDYQKPAYGDGLYLADYLAYAAVYAGYHGHDHFGKIAVFAVIVDEGENVHKHETDGDLDAHAPPLEDWENYSARKVVGRFGPNQARFRHIPGDPRAVTVCTGKLGHTGLPLAKDVFNEFVIPPNRVETATEVAYLLILDRKPHVQQH